MLPQTRRVDIEDMATPGNNSSVLERCGRTHKLCLQREVPETHSSQRELLKTQISCLPFHLEENPRPCLWHSRAFRMFLWPHLLLLAFPHFVPLALFWILQPSKHIWPQGLCICYLTALECCSARFLHDQLSSLDLHSNVSSLRGHLHLPYWKHVPSHLYLISL